MTRLLIQSLCKLCAVILLSHATLYGAWEYKVKPEGSEHVKDVHTETVNQIIKNHLIVSGHRKLIEGESAFRMSGKNKLAWSKRFGIDHCDYEALIVPPNSGYIKYSFYYRGATRTIHEAYDSTFVWRLDRIFGEPEVKELGFANRAKQVIRMLPSLLFVDPNLQPDWVAYKGKKFLGDREVYKVEFGYISLENIQLFFDVETSLLMEVRSRGVLIVEESSVDGKCGQTPMLCTDQEVLIEKRSSIDWKWRVTRYEKQDEMYLPADSEMYREDILWESVKFTDFEFVDTWEKDVFNTRAPRDSKHNKAK